MKPRSSLALFFLLAFALSPVVAAPETPAPTPTPAAPAEPPAASARELAIVVVEPLTHHSGLSTPFHYLDTAFRDVAKARKWPVKLVVERLGGNSPDHPTELRVFYKGLSEETPGRFVLRTWATFTDQGKEHDFGIVKVSYYPRATEQNDEMKEKIYRNMAETIAAKIEPLLFPKP